MWLPRVAEAVRAADRPVALIGGEAFGAPFVVESLRQHEPLAWLELDPWGDQVAHGNALARAVNGELPAPLLSLALPYKSHLAALARYRTDLRPLRIAVTTTDLSLPIVGDLLDLHGNGYSVVLDVRGSLPPDAEVLSRCLVLDEGFLKVTLDEAIALAPGGLGQAAVERLWRTSEGRFTDLASAAYQAAGLPRLHVPSAGGPLLPESAPELVDVRQAIYAYMREGDPVSALELAVLKAPDLVDDLLKHAGPAVPGGGAPQPPARAPLGVAGVALALGAGSRVAARGGDRHERLPRGAARRRRLPGSPHRASPAGAPGRDPAARRGLRHG